ncbi:MAG TPA: DUF58 domain-containing protein [Actinomycetota bacterium]|nr:DUF58 domain-containing protein [Actinomycetota bacterium]
MLTVRGWAVALTGLALLVVARIFGSGPVEQFGFALVVLPLIALAVVRLGKHDLAVTRRTTPERVRAGGKVKVTLEIRNQGRGPAPLLLLEDRVASDVAGRARFALHGVEPKGRRYAAYELRPPRRGHYQVGPLTLTSTDPFGLARLVSSAAPRASVLVHPRIEPLSLPRDLGDRRSLAVSALRQPIGAQGEDFYTLREYNEGDDLRKVHWPATAKRGRYMIRQEETPWHTRATVVFDDRTRAHDGIGDASSFERVVEATASIVDLYHRSGYTYRLAGAAAAGLPAGKGSAHFNRALDLLATVGTSLPPVLDADPLIARLLEIDAGTAGEGTLAVVAGTLAHEDAIAITRCRRRFRQVIVVMFPGHRFGSMTTKARWAAEEGVREVVKLLARAGAQTIVVGPEESLLSGWDSLTRSAASAARHAPAPSGGGPGKNAPVGSP